ncbi:MAG: DinB family protein [Saprospiraceae bacterium]|nr:DinB family protein [Saprospiraceae bacterium]MBK6567114.1 DinB family protein [Saprospiraceae bacterium]MBK8549428.1 DinB family protein [Saprospiraceae bacterium]MBK8819812.1 DinB family protein [Saprospiraceae bacterium]MBK8855174.1 DinB family protein [Saprospiraceae bacterium]
MKNWSKELSNLTEQFQTHFGGLSKEELNWKPNPAVWSIAQNIDHLIVVNKSYYPTFEALKKGNYKPPFMARIGWIVSYIGTKILDAVHPDRRNKMKTFPIWEPEKSSVDGDILSSFENQQAELAQKTEDLRDQIQKGMVISSPANRYIVYTLETALNIIISHEKRHLEQAKEVLALLLSGNKI